MLSGGSVLKAAAQSEPAFLAQQCADTFYFQLALNQRGFAGVHRVVTCDQFVRMLDCRSQHEVGITLGDDVDGAIRFLENHQFTRADLAARVELSSVDCQPAYAMARRRCVAPVLAIL